MSVRAAVSRRVVARFDSPRALKAATLRECKARADRAVMQLRGHPWTARELEYLRATNSGRALERLADLDRQARALCEEGFSFITRVREFEAQLTASDPRTDFIVALQPLSACAQQLERSLKHGTNNEDRHATNRRLLVVAWDKVGPWWWPDRRPSRTDLAVLSILAGNLPDVRRAMSKLSFDPTAAAVIEREAVYIDETRKALGLSSPERRRKRS